MRTFSLSFLGTCGLLAAAACDDDSVATPQLDDTCGTFRVETAAELAELTHCRTIDELVVVSSETTAVELPKFERFRRSSVRVRCGWRARTVPPSRSRCPS
jgi:hypothetical protein